MHIQDERSRIESLGGCVLFFGGWRVNGSLAVSRSIGDSEQKPFITGEPDVEEYEMEGIKMNLNATFDLKYIFNFIVCKARIL